MSKLFNLNITEYNKKELEELFSLEFPYTRKDVSICGNKMKTHLFQDKSLTEHDKDKVGIFVESATEQLTESLADGILEQKLQKSKVLDSGGHMIIKPNDTDQMKKWRGTLNPLNTTIWNDLDYLVTTTLNIDSSFRKNYYRTSSTNFDYILSHPIKNAVQMELVGFELPPSIYNMSTALGNNFFTLQWDPSGNNGVGVPTAPPGVATVVIPDGHYKSCSDEPCYRSIQDELNFQLSRPPPNGTSGLIQAVLDNRTGKVIIAAAADASLNNLDLIFNLDVSNSLVDSLYGTQRIIHTHEQPLQLKLGWQLGYRFGRYTGSTAYVTEGVYDVRGFRYLYLIVKDYQKNHPQNIIGMFSDSMAGQGNILARFSWKQFAVFSTTNDSLNDVTTSRNYFGPVNINKLTFQLVDQFGRNLSINNMDWSMALQFKTLYKV